MCVAFRSFSEFIQGGECETKNKKQRKIAPRPRGAPASSVHGTSGRRAGGGPPGPRRPRPACRPGAGAIASPDFHFHRGEIKGNTRERGPFFEWGPVFLSGGRGVEPDPTQTNRRGRPPNFFLSRKTSSPPCFQQTLVNHTKLAQLPSCFELG